MSSVPCHHQSNLCVCVILSAGVDFNVLNSKFSFDLLPGKRAARRNNSQRKVCVFFFFATLALGSQDGNVGQSRLKYISTIAMKFSTDFYGPQWMNLNDFCDPLTFPVVLPCLDNHWMDCLEILYAHSCPLTFHLVPSLGHILLYL